MSGEEYLLSLFHKKSDSNYIGNVYINQRACPFVKYYKDRLTVKYLGKGLLYSDITSIQSNKAANRDTLIYYFEVKINEIGHRGDISIGLADADFPLNKHPGWTKKSYGYKADGKVYSNKQAIDTTMPKFTTDNYVGCGINYFKREIFFTYNGEYTGPAFKDVEVKEFYATIGLHSLNECVTFNFGSRPFKFDLEKLILEEKRESVKSILKQPINHYSLHQIVHSYLNFHGYAHTLEAFEKAAQIERRDVGLPRSEVFEEMENDKAIKVEDDLEDGETKDSKRKKKKASGEDMDIESKKDGEQNGTNGQNHSDDVQRRSSHELRFRSDSLRLEFESPNFTMSKDHFISDMEPLVLNSENNNAQNRDFVLFKKASFCVDFDNNGNSLTPGFASHIQNHTANNQNNNNNNKNTIANDLKPNTYLIHERAALRHILLEGNVTEAINYINKLFPTLLEQRKELLKMLHTQQFIEFIKAKDYHSAITYAQKSLTQYQRENVYCLDDKNVAREVPIDSLMALLCYPDPEKSELKNFLTLEQRDLTADFANREILKTMGFIDKSILDVLVAQLTATEQVYRENNAHYGEAFEFGV